MYYYLKFEYKSSDSDLINCHESLGMWRQLRHYVIDSRQGERLASAAFEEGARGNVLARCYQLTPLKKRGAAGILW